MPNEHEQPQSGAPDGPGFYWLGEGKRRRVVEVFVPEHAPPDVVLVNDTRGTYLNCPVRHIDEPWGEPRTDTDPKIFTRLDGKMTATLPDDCTADPDRLAAIFSVGDDGEFVTSAAGCVSAWLDLDTLPSKGHVILGSAINADMPSKHYRVVEICWMEHNLAVALIKPLDLDAGEGSDEA